MAAACAPSRRLTSSAITDQVHADRGARHADVQQRPGIHEPRRDPILRGGFEVALGHLRLFAEGAAPAGTGFVLLAYRHQCVAQVQ